MYALLAGVFMISLGVSQMTLQAPLEAPRVQKPAHALAQSLSAYRTSVAAFARANPTVTGQATVAQLAAYPVPGYIASDNLSHVLNGDGTGWVYIASLTPIQRAGLVHELGARSEGSLQAGFKGAGGTLINDSTGDTAIPVPVGIPAGSVAWRFN